MNAREIPSDHELAGTLDGARWRRVVVLGDSLAAGVRETVDGWPDRSWTDWIAAALPAAQHWNLGKRDLLASEVREQQLARALRLRPDLAIVCAGGNDMLRQDFDPVALTRELDAIVAPLRASRADVLLIELLDIVASGLIPAEYADMLDRKLATLAEVTRDVAARHGTILVEMRRAPVDAEMFSSDLMHLNTRGHAIAGTESVRTLRAAYLRASSAPGRSRATDSCS
jgi:lysophospholipase L1-like esterase